MSKEKAKSFGLVRENFVSRRAAARMLGVAPATVTILAARNNVRTMGIQGHCRKWFHAGDIANLLIPPQEIQAS